MSLYKKFKTDPVLEQEGILFQYGDDFRLRIRRAGGANKKYALAVEKALKPWRQPGKDLDKEEVKVRKDLWTQIFVEACYVEHSWETKTDEGYQHGILDENDTLVPATSATVLAILKDLPEVSQILQNASSELEHYLAALKDATIDNLKA